MDQVKVAVLGFGGMGKWHCEKQLTIPEVINTGVYDILEERNALAREAGFLVYG